MRPVYSNIAALLEVETAQHLINLVVDRSNGELSDEDVQEQLMRNIARASRDWDGYVRGHMDLPIEPVLIELTGALAFTNGSDVVTGTGTLFTTEIEVDDWIHPQDNYNAIHIVREVISDTELRLSCDFYAASIGGTGSEGAKANIYVSGVPDEVEDIVNCYTCYRLWRNRGRRSDETNPFFECKEVFLQRTKEIQKGQFRFYSEEAGEVATKPARSGKRYDRDVDAKYEFTKHNFKGFYGD